MIPNIKHFSKWAYKHGACDEGIDFIKQNGDTLRSTLQASRAEHSLWATWLFGETSLFASLRPSIDAFLAKRKKARARCYAQKTNAFRQMGVGDSELSDEQQDEYEARCKYLDRLRDRKIARYWKVFVVKCLAYIEE